MIFSYIYIYVYIFLLILLHTFKTLFCVFSCFKKSPKKKNTTNGSSPIPIFQTSSRKDQFSEFQAPRPILCIQHPAYSLVDKSKNLTRHRTPGRQTKTTPKKHFCIRNFCGTWKILTRKKSILLHQFYLKDVCLILLVPHLSGEGC